MPTDGEGADAAGFSGSLPCDLDLLAINALRTPATDAAGTALSGMKARFWPDLKGTGLARPAVRVSR